MASLRHSHEKIYVSVDSVVFGYRDRKLHVPLFRRSRRNAHDPFPGRWSLAGGPLFRGESLEVACRRKLEEDIGLQVEYLEQLYTFGAPDRDPRDRAISVSYFALVRWNGAPLSCGPEVEEARWFELSDRPADGYAFDHHQILETAIQRLRSKLLYQPIGLNLLGAEFSMTDLKAIYDTVLDRTLDKRNFAKKMLSLGLLVPARTVRQARGRPAQLYRFDARVYARLQHDGFSIGT